MRNTVKLWRVGGVNKVGGMSEEGWGVELRCMNVLSGHYYCGSALFCIFKK